MIKTWKPVGDRIIVKQIKIEPAKKSAIIKPTTSSRPDLKITDDEKPEYDEHPTQFEVVAVSPFIKEDAKYCKVGDIVTIAVTNDPNLTKLEPLIYDKQVYASTSMYNVILVAGNE